MTKAAVLPNAVVRVEAIFSKRKGDLAVLFFMVNTHFTVKKKRKRCVYLFRIYRKTENFDDFIWILSSSNVSFAAV